jgi:hypothetical protein
MNLHTLTLWTHVGAGTTALVAFWLNAALPKGSALHTRVGRGYLITMIVVMATAASLAWHAFSQGAPVKGLFLTYLVVITATPTWLAWRAIRDRRDFSVFTGACYRALAALSIVSGLFVLAAGLRYSVPLLAGFSLVGIITGAVMLRFVARGAAQPRWWLREHYFAVAGCGVATHIAFINIGASRLVPGGWEGMMQTLGWFVPVLVAVLARVWLDRKYGFARATASRAAKRA